MAILKIKDETGKFIDIPAIQGGPGPQGPVGPQGPEGPQGPAGESGVSLEEVKAITGELENLSTEDKSNLVNAINELALNKDDVNIYYVKSKNGYYNSSKTWNFEDVTDEIANIINNNLNKHIAIVLEDAGGYYGLLPQYVKTPVRDFSGSSEIHKMLIYKENASNDIYTCKFYITTSGSASTGQIGVYNIRVSDYDTIPTKKYVDDKTGDLTTLATEDKTNLVNAINEVANSGGGSSQMLVWNFKYTDETKALFQTWLDRFWETNEWNTIILHQEGFRQIPLQYACIEEYNKKAYLYFGYNQEGRPEKQLDHASVTLTLDNTLKTVTGVTGDTALRSHKYVFPYRYNPYGGTTTLTTDNDKEFTPTSNYHPATKKYVDDAVKTSIGTALEGSY